MLNFIKYINSLAKSKVFYLLSCSFFGASDGDESEDSLSSAGEDFEDDFELDDEFVSYLLSFLHKLLCLGRGRALVGCPK